MKRLYTSVFALSIFYLSIFSFLPCLALAATELTAEQKVDLILRPEHCDSMYGKTDRIYLNGFWKFKKEINILKKKGPMVVLSA